MEARVELPEDVEYVWYLRHIQGGELEKLQERYIFKFCRDPDIQP